MSLEDDRHWLEGERPKNVYTILKTWPSMQDKCIASLCTMQSQCYTVAGHRDYASEISFTR